LEHGGGVEDLGEVVNVSDGGQVFNAVREADLLGGKVNRVEVEEGVGGDGFAEG